MTATLTAPAPASVATTDTMPPVENFWQGKRVLITGHAGFKGSWLCMILQRFGAKLYGFSLLPHAKPRIYNLLNIPELLTDECIADISDSAALADFVRRCEPEIVLHLAAQPLVRESYRDPLTTYRTNVLGTLNVLEACHHCPSVKAVVNVTTDKCYENPEDGHAFVESDPLGGYDLYSSSKACSEILSASYRRSLLQEPHAMCLATARAGNVIGGGDFADDRLLPDCIRALSDPDNGTIVLRYPQAIRPWQHVLEPLFGYITLAQRLYQRESAYCGAFNFGPEQSQVLSVEQVAQQVVKIWGSGQVQVEAHDHLHEAGLLLLDSSKAKQLLGFKPVLTASEAIEWTVQWYQLWQQGAPSDVLRTLTRLQISEFVALREA